MAQTVKCLPTMWETRVRSLGGEDSLEKEMPTHPSTLAWKIPREEPGPWGRKESDTTEQLHFTSTSGLALAYIVLLQKWLMICFCSEISKN